MDNIISICHENKIHQFACELEHTTNEERKDKLRTILYQLKNDQTEQPLNKARKELDNMCIKMTENQFKKTWNRLTSDQKKTQIRKYYETNISDEETRRPEIDKVLKILEDKQLKPKMINYDPQEGKIIEIKLKS